MPLKLVLLVHAFIIALHFDQIVNDNSSVYLQEILIADFVYEDNCSLIILLA